MARLIADRVVFSLVTPKRMPPTYENVEPGELLVWDLLVKAFSNVNTETALQALRALQVDLTQTQNASCSFVWDRRYFATYPYRIEDVHNNGVARVNAESMDYGLLRVPEHGLRVGQLTARIRDEWAHINVLGPTWLTDWEKANGAHQPDIRAYCQCGHAADRREFRVMEKNLSANAIWLGNVDLIPRLSIERPPQESGEQAMRPIDA